MARTVHFLSFTLTKVVQDHGKGTATKQKRKVLAILLGVGLEALEGRKKNAPTDRFLSRLLPPLHPCRPGCRGEAILFP